MTNCPKLQYTSKRTESKVHDLHLMSYLYKRSIIKSITDGYIPALTPQENKHDILEVD